MSVPSLDWTVAIYIGAPDPSLQAPAFKLLFDELPKVGSSDRVHVVLQMDTTGSPARRVFVNVAGQLPPLVSDPIDPDQNTGSVDAFVDFIKFVKANHEAKHYLVVLNGHGHGVEDFPGDENHVALKAFSSVMASAEASPALALNGAIGSSASNSVSPELLPDENPPDALTSRELKEALERASQVLGTTIDIVGFDACLMSMIEIAMQIDKSASLMVGSEQTIPSKGWPYSQIIKKLIESPDLDPRKLAATIVDQFLAFYETDAQKEQVMLAACDLSKAQGLSDTIGKLVPRLSQCLTIPALRLALLRARFVTLSFFDSDFLDLFNFCGHLSETLDTPAFQSGCSNNATLCEELKTTCKAIMQQISNDGGTGFVTKSGVTFADVSPIKDARGVSVYLPLILPLYRELEFSKQTRWHDFLEEYMTTFFMQAMN